MQSPLGAKTMNAAKPRVRAGMDRCQGGFRGPKVLKILCRKLGYTPDEINKNEPGSYKPAMERMSETMYELFTDVAEIGGGSLVSLLQWA